MKPTIPWIWECQDCGKIHEGLYHDPSWFYWCDCGGDITCLQEGELPDLDDPEVFKDYYGIDKEEYDADYAEFKRRNEMKMTETGESGA